MSIITLNFKRSKCNLSIKIRNEHDYTFHHNSFSTQTIQPSVQNPEHRKKEKRSINLQKATKIYQEDTVCSKSFLFWVFLFGSDLVVFSQFQGLEINEIGSDAKPYCPAHPLVFLTQSCRMSQPIGHLSLWCLLSYIR